MLSVIVSIELVDDIVLLGHKFLGIQQKLEGLYDNMNKIDENK